MTKKARDTVTREDDGASAQGPPPYDPVAVGKVARRVEIQDVHLLGSHFERSDDEEAIPRRPASSDIPDSTGIGIEWELSDAGDALGCVFTFATVFEGEEAGEQPPYSLIARFRLLYTISGDEPPTDYELSQFAHWNALFNAWPYWREYLMNTIARAELEPFVVGVMGIPRWEEQV